jgi:glutaredoxin
VSEGLPTGLRGYRRADGAAGRGRARHTGVVTLPDGPRVRVLTRAGCHLCDDAVTVVRDVCAAAGESFDTLDIDAAGDKDLLAAYSDQVPVIFVDGNLHDFWRVDPARLAGALGRPR